MDLEADPMEMSGPFCSECGNELEWVECHTCGGEGGRDGEELVEEDPLWYTLDDWERCTDCGGNGGWLECPTCIERARQQEQAAKE